VGEIGIYLVIGFFYVGRSNKVSTCSGARVNGGAGIHEGRKDKNKYECVMCARVREHREEKKSIRHNSKKCRTNTTLMHKTVKSCFILSCL
jgi:hypothetical protein